VRALATDQEECDGTLHTGGEMGRQCPLTGYRAALRQHAADISKMAGALAAIGWEGDAEANDLGLAILRAVDRSVAVSDLKSAVRTAVEYGKTRPAMLGHLLLTGTTGTAKTMIAIGLRLCWLRRGMRSIWITGRDITDMSRLYDSFERSERNAFVARLKTWADYGTVFLEDLADEKGDPRLGAGEGTRATVLQRLLNDSTALYVVTSNLRIAELEQHQDAGPRVMSRLTADRCGKRAVQLHLEGPDQRQRAK
jgi:DNA replication protein DnaC